MTEDPEARFQCNSRHSRNTTYLAHDNSLCNVVDGKIYSCVNDLNIYLKGEWIQTRLKNLLWRRPIKFPDGEVLTKPNWHETKEDFMLSWQGAFKDIFYGPWESKIDDIKWSKE